MKTILQATSFFSQQAWCDMETDGGGFMLIGVQDSPITWDVPSYPKLIKPLDTRCWSSSFGNMFIQEFRIQVSISKSFYNTKAHWLEFIQITTKNI